jgi:hypothetical protein
MPCNKVLGKKGILATFLKQKDKDPLPKPWRYASDTVGAQGFLSASGVGFRVQLITKNPQGSNPSQSSEKTSTTPLGSAEQLIAYNNMKKSMIPKSAGQLFRFHYSPNAVQSYIKFLESDLTSAMSYWTSVYTNKELFNVFYGTELDLDWLIEAWRPYGFDSNTGFAEDFRGRIKREGTRLNAGAVPSQPGSSHLSILRHSSLPTTPNTFIPHENVHIVQQFLTKNKTGEMPCWLREGSADLFGSFISNEMYGGGDWYNSGKRGAINNYLGGTSGIELRNFNKDEWFTHLKSLEGNFSGNCEYSRLLAYGSGLLLSELLMAEGGFDKMMEFWRAFSLEEDWRKSFKNIYGVEIDIWYKTKGVPYLMQEYVRIKKY